MQSLKLLLSVNGSETKSKPFGTVVSATWKRDSVMGETTPVTMVIDPDGDNPIELPETISTDGLFDQITNGDYLILDVEAISY